MRCLFTTRLLKESVMDADQTLTVYKCRVCRRHSFLNGGVWHEWAYMQEEFPAAIMTICPDCLVPPSDNHPVYESGI